MPSAAPTPTTSSQPPLPSETNPLHPDIPPFPDPSTFSILPDIYLLISRLHILQSQSQPQSAEKGKEQQQIETKDLPQLVYPIKQKIVKARAAVQALPDVERSVQQQEAEIELLEMKIGALRKRLGELGGIAAASSTAGNGSSREIKSEAPNDESRDVVMRGVEG